MHRTSVLCLLPNVCSLVSKTAGKFWKTICEDAEGLLYIKGRPPFRGVGMMPLDAPSILSYSILISCTHASALMLLIQTHTQTDIHLHTELAYTQTECAYTVVAVGQECMGVTTAHLHIYIPIWPYTHGLLPSLTLVRLCQFGKALTVCHKVVENRNPRLRFNVAIVPC
jgi:hypothetical protein